MQTLSARRSDRIALSLHVTVSGTDCLGQVFLEETQTLLVSRHGAKIALRRKLVPELELSLCCAETGKEADVRVVGQIGTGPEGTYYGLEILDPNVNLWGIEFPPLAESEEAVGRVLLECIPCRTRELVYLDEFEAEVFETHKILSRACKRCRDMTLWKLSEGPTQEAHLRLPDKIAASIALLPSVRALNERKEIRVRLRIKACIRASLQREETVWTENVSRGGFAFKSSRHYAPGSVVEACVPYTPGAGNIFSPARIEHGEETPEQGTFSYGVAYIPVHKGWPEK